MAEIHWRDAKGRHVPLDEPAVSGYLRGATPMAETEFPATRGDDGSGWTEVSDTYRAPSRATRAVVELHLRWAPGGEVALARRVADRDDGARAAHGAAGHRPLQAVGRQDAGGQPPACTSRSIAEAARQKADLVVLGETLTYLGLGKKYHEVAEPIPGPSTEYFGQLAKKHNLYIVAGLLERDGHLVYNVAVLIGPDGTGRRQVPQGLPAARRGRGRHRAGLASTRSSRPGSARSA